MVAVASELISETLNNSLTTENGLLKLIVGSLAHYRVEIGQRLDLTLLLHSSCASL